MNAAEVTNGMRSGCRLGVDVGSTRVGLAGCDADGILATPIATLPRSGADLAEITQAAARLNAIEVVVGLPRSLSGALGPAAHAARAYATTLAGRLEGIPVRLVDERFTTVDAQRALQAAGRSTRQHRAVIDQVAAVMILQSALDAERAAGHPPGELVSPRPRRRGRRRSGASAGKGGDERAR